MTVKIDTTARIEKIRVQPRGAFPAGDPESGYGWLYFVTGTANGGMYFENDAGMRIGPFITGSTPPGYVFDYVEITGSVNVTGASEGAATTIITSNSITYDGLTAVMIEFYAPDVQPGTSYVILDLHDDTANGFLGFMSFQLVRNSVHVVRKITPAAGARVYSIRGLVDAGTGAVNVGGGGAGVRFPAFLRISKAN